ncbi:MAG: penicillin acylase family protein [Acidobacteria bacterium]|nr:penicillin acylase family protein [Acidobacteriota bacterium]
MACTRLLFLSLFLLLQNHSLAAGSGFQGVRVQRDSYGVPHISAPTDAGAVYGLMYAQAEDNFGQIQSDFTRALGRAAEFEGPSQLINDLLHRAFEIDRLARQEYARMAPAARSLCDAHAAALNQYMADHPQGQPYPISRFEPWHILAMQLSSGLSGAVSSGKFTRAEIAAAYPALAPWLSRPAPAAVAPNEDEGSNMWALAPARSRNGRALLLINPHVGFFGGGQRYEAHLNSKQGLRVSGFAILGTPYIRSGWTPTHGWSHTNNYADTVDVWREAPDAQFSPWQDTLRIKSSGSVETVTVQFRKTIRGPVIALRNGAPHTARIAGHDRGGILEQRVALARARSLKEFQAALALRAFTGSNTIYADNKGNIFYLHGCLIPKRAPGVDPASILEGQNPAHQWQGYHEISELPQFLNPPSGYLQNCNSTPFGAAGDPPATPPAGFPAYLAPEADGLRARNSRRILSAAQRADFEQWSTMALDTSVYSAADDLKRLPAQGPPELQPLLDELHHWNRVSAIDSVAMTLYTRWARLKAQDPLAALAQVRAELEKLHGTWRVPYGSITRLQRIHTSGTQEQFGKDKPSLPVAGGSGTLGMLFVFNTRQPAADGIGYGISGNTYVAVVEFGSKPKARSLLVFGQSADPKSPHYFDQAPLYSEKRFKDVR